MSNVILVLDAYAVLVLYVMLCIVLFWPACGSGTTGGWRQEAQWFEAGRRCLMFAGRFRIRIDQRQVGSPTEREGGLE